MIILVSHFPPQPLASGMHYRAHARICATRDGLPFGTRYLLTDRHGRRLGVFTKADICGRHRVDIPNTTFRDLFGAAGMKMGVVPVQCRVLGHGVVVGSARRGRHHK